MTPQDAISSIKTYMRLPSGRLSETGKLAIEALDKQIPKKPNESYDGYVDGYPVWDFSCPFCGEEIEEGEHHCRCGQATDWEGCE